ncbi:hydroxylysine kinase-like [Antedon mediterranea]|uniref:hydroxylysine kinase-like n=1 Tax=Antedon mediterranea TaxID=105859 RepID=UPI003AF460E4
MSYENFCQESFIPLITSDDVPGLVDNLYGIAIEGVQELTGYSDKNFYVKVSQTSVENECSKFVLKITNLEDSRNVGWLDGQTAMMRHMSAQGVACSRPIANLNGNYMHLVSMEKNSKGIRKYGTYIVRLLSYMKGEIMAALEFDSTLLHRLGVFLAEIKRHFEDFSHEYFKQMDDYEWNLTKIVEIAPSKLAALTDKKRQLSESVIDEFRTNVLPKCSQLKEGVIHGDFRPANIVVDYTGDNASLSVIDFGDSIRSYVLFDLVITLAHTMLYDIDSYLNVARQVIAGYTSVIQLPTWQIRLLRTCIQARLVQVLVLCYNRYIELPFNEDYLLGCERQGGWKLVEILHDLSDTEWLRTVTNS